MWSVMMIIWRIPAEMGVEAERALTTRDDQPNVTVLDRLGLQRVVDRLGHFRLV